MSEKSNEDLIKALKILYDRIVKIEKKVDAIAEQTEAIRETHKMVSSIFNETA